MIDMKTTALMPGLIVGKNVIGMSGQILIGKGIKLNTRTILQLKEHGIPGVAIMQSIDLLNPLSAEKFKRKHSVYDKSADVEESYQMMVRALVEDDLSHFAMVYLNEMFHHLNEFNHIKTKMKQMIKEICVDAHVISILSMMKGMEPDSIKRYSQVLVIGLLIGFDLGLESEKLNSLSKACLFYNIGHYLMMNRFNITSLSNWKQDQKVYESHTILGHKYLLDYFEEDVAKVALEHHERFAGGGFPQDKSGSEISLISKIVMVAGKYISLQYSNSLRPGCKSDLAMDYIFNVEGYLLDTNVVNSFRKHITPYPLGSILELSDGSRVMVVKNGTGPDYDPLVKVILARSDIFEQGKFIHTRDLTDLYIKGQLLVN